MTTPTPPDPYATEPPADAVARLWFETTPQDRDHVREVHPILARALDRLTEYEQTPPGQRRAHIRSGPPPWQERDDEGSDR